MNGKRTICMATSGRADYGLLLWPMRAIAEAADLDLQVLVTGAHLESRFGLTVVEIERDGFAINACVPMGLDSDEPQALAAASARLLAGAADVLATLRPDMLMVLGDRYETLALVQAATLLRLPIAHIAGGEVTEGAFDEGARHAITKLSHLHLVTHDAARRRVIQLGEQPARVIVVGNPGLDRLRRDPPMSDATLEARLARPLGARNLLATFHPVTLAADNGLSQLRSLLAALSDLPPEMTIWWTRANADPGGRAVNAEVEAWAGGRANVELRDALGAVYLPLMARCEAVVGNSSSGLLEAPSVRVPTVNIGDRQAGRTAGPSVIHAEAHPAYIRRALARAFAREVSSFDNPYGDGHSAERIVEALRAAPSRDQLIRKRFHDL